MIRKARSDRAAERLLNQGVAIIVACPSKDAQREQVCDSDTGLTRECYAD